MTSRHIANIKDQTVTISINGVSFRFRFFAFRELMYVDISKKDADIVTGKRIMTNRWLLPVYAAEGIGNIRFETYKADEDDYVWYEGFNTKYRLVSYRANEIEKMEAETMGE